MKDGRVGDVAEAEEEGKTPELAALESHHQLLWPQSNY